MSKSKLGFISVLSSFFCALPAQSSEFPRIVAFGDFGEVDQRNQVKNVALMKQVAGQDAFTAGLLLGDNFYPHGVSSVHDQQFADKFVNIYKDLNIPFYAVLGNHDYGENHPQGGRVGGNWQAQIDFTKSSLNPVVNERYKIKLWNMPKRYYEMRYAVSGQAGDAGKEVSIFALDTEPARYPFETEHPIGNDQFLLTKANYWREQMEWLETRLKNSPTRWNIVIGHHPILSDGTHGDSRHLDERRMDRNLKEIVCKYADLYMSGHEHSLQFFDDIDCDGYSQEPMPQIISGAGGTNSLVTRFRKDRAVFKENRDGFVTLDFDDSHLTARAYVVPSRGKTHDGSPDFELKLKNRSGGTHRQAPEASFDHALPLSTGPVGSASQESWLRRPSEAN